MSKRKTKIMAADYPALECPNCGTLTKCSGVAKDGGAKYRCRQADGTGHQCRSWCIDMDGNLRYGKAFA